MIHSLSLSLSESDWLFTEQHQPKKERMTPAASLVLFPSLAWFSGTEEPTSFPRGAVLSDLRAFEMKN